MHQSRGILWDFDGTLAYRTGFWTDLLVEALDIELPGHGFAAATFRSAIGRGFPWHEWERPHPELDTADAWWAPVTDLIRGALLEAGADPAIANGAAERVRGEYLRMDRWQLFPDTVSILDRLAGDGWRHAILSNHVPELPDIVAALGIADRFDAILTSARMGYDKPHPETFALGRIALGEPATLWMVGDNPVADIEGASRSGIPGILVRQQVDGSTERSDLSELLTILGTP